MKDCFKFLYKIYVTPLILYLSDFNECALNGGPGPCQQICTNTVGSYYCSCQPGFTLSTNGTSCNGEHMGTLLTHSKCCSHVYK